MAYIQNQLFSLIHHPSENGCKAHMGPLQSCVKRSQCTGGLHCWGNRPTTCPSDSFPSSGFTKDPPGALCQVNKPGHNLYEGWPHLSKVIWSKCLYVEKSRKRELEIHLLQYEKELFQWQNWVPFSFHFIPFYSMQIFYPKHVLSL